MNPLQAFIKDLEIQLAVLREHASKDVAKVETDITRARQVITAEIEALIGKLHAL